MEKLILASASERRSQILTSCNIKHKIVVTDVDELDDENKSISEVVQLNAIKKSESLKDKFKESVILGADTLVLFGDEKIGKPKDEDEAKGMLKKFSGNNLEVYTGLCLIDTKSKKETAGFVKSELKVVSLSESEIDGFFKLLSPYDKAGGFSIEGVGSILFDDIKGSYFNILGLPMTKLKNLFTEIELNIMDYIG